MIRKLFYLLSLIFICSCGSALYIPKEPSVIYNASLEELQTGRKHYIDYCSSCHALYNPASYSKDNWTKQVDEMAERSHINNEQKELILKYLWTASAAAN